MKKLLYNLLLYFEFSFAKVRGTKILVKLYDSERGIIRGLRKKFLGLFD